MSYECIEFDQAGGIATIRFNRPERFNSVNQQMHDDLKAVLTQISGDKGLRCLVITGNGKAFCAGQDLNDRYEMLQSGVKPNLGESLRANYNAVLKQITALTIPVICAVNGVAAGAGVGLALAADIVVAARSASFNFAFAKVGLIPDAGTSWALVQAVGLPRAKALTLLGDRISAEEAQQMGLIWDVVDATELDQLVATLCANLAANPAVGLGLTRRALMGAAANGFSEQLSLEAQLQTVAGRSADYKEAVFGFIEKRPSNFTGE